MKRRIPDPLTLEDLRRDPELIFAVHARARRMRTEENKRLLAGLLNRLRAWRLALGAPVAREYRPHVS